jgi:moderate conductance mechanosensitive channel
VNGVAWYIRNSTIKQTGNESQSWARAVVDFPVPYNRDVATVREVMQEATSNLWQDSSWRDVLLDVPEVWGVQELSSESVLMRVTARTAPHRQWDVARELRERLKSALDAADGGAPAVGAAPPDGSAHDRG